MRTRVKENLLKLTMAEYGLARILDCDHEDSSHLRLLDVRYDKPQTPRWDLSFCTVSLTKKLVALFMGLDGQMLGPTIVVHMCQLRKHSQNTMKQATERMSMSHISFKMKTYENHMRCPSCFLFGYSV